MRTLLKSIIFFLSFCAGVTMSVSAHSYNALQQKKPDLHVVGIERCPYNCEVFIDTNKQANKHQITDPFHTTQPPGRGYVIEIIEEIFENSPDGDPKDEVHKVIYKTMSQERAVRRVKAGIYHILLGLQKNDETKKSYIFPKESIGISSNRFYIRSDQNWRFNDINSLQKVRLGLVFGHDYNEIREYIEINKNSKNSIEIISDENAIDLNMRKLAKGRLDVIFENKYVIDYHRKIMGLDSTITEAQTSNPNEFKSDEIYLAFSKEIAESSDYAKQFDEGMIRLRNSGKLAEILKKYGLRDWKR